MIAQQGQVALPSLRPTLVDSRQPGRCMMTPDEDMALKFAVVALRNALLKRAVLSQADIDVELGDIFAKIAIDKTLVQHSSKALGSTLLRLSTMREPSCTRA